MPASASPRLQHCRRKQVGGFQPRHTGGPQRRARPCSSLRRGFVGSHGNKLGVCGQRSAWFHELHREILYHRCQFSRTASAVEGEAFVHAGFWPHKIAAVAAGGSLENKEHQAGLWIDRLGGCTACLQSRNRGLRSNRIRHLAGHQETARGNQ